MEINQKHAFWEALVISIFIFGLGVLIGVFIENSRAGKISELYLKSEIDMLDIKIQTEMLELNLDCEEINAENIKFGDKIYNEAKILDRYESASRITNSLKEQHRRYDMLRTLFWMNSIKIKEKCGFKFSNVVYLYDYQPENIADKNKQIVFSRYLMDLKQKYGNEIILIPIAKNNNLSSLNMFIKQFNITSSAAIILDEKVIVDNLENLDKIADYLENKK